MYTFFIWCNFFFLKNSNQFISYPLKENIKVYSVNYKVYVYLFSSKIIQKFSKFFQLSRNVLLISPSHLALKTSSFVSNNFTSFFIRKFKVFNKGRYSRTRQLYRTGVYWCLFLNILLVVGLYLWFYRFTMNFGYLWWFFITFIFYLVAGRSLSYNYFYTLHRTVIFFYQFILIHFFKFKSSLKKLLKNILCAL